MRRLAAEALLQAMTVLFGYDVSYMRHMLRHAPRAYAKFERLFPLAGHREAAPREAIFAAKLVAAMAEDCGPCTQLVVNMARRDGMADAQVRAVLQRDVGAMDAGTALGFRYADAIVHALPDAGEVCETVRAAWGEKGLVEMALAIAVSRVFPMTKAGLGFAETCARVRVNADDIVVAKRAA